MSKTSLKNSFQIFIHLRFEYFKDSEFNISQDTPLHITPDNPIYRKILPMLIPWKMGNNT